MSFACGARDGALGRSQRARPGPWPHQGGAWCMACLGTRAVAYITGPPCRRGERARDGGGHRGGGPRRPQDPLHAGRHPDGRRGDRHGRAHRLELPPRRRRAQPVGAQRDASRARARPGAPPVSVDAARLSAHCQAAEAPWSLRGEGAVLRMSRLVRLVHTGTACVHDHACVPCGARCLHALISLGISVANFRCRWSACGSLSWCRPMLSPSPQRCTAPCDRQATPGRPRRRRPR